MYVYEVSLNLLLQSIANHKELSYYMHISVLFGRLFIVSFWPNHKKLLTSFNKIDKIPVRLSIMRHLKKNQTQFNSINTEYEGTFSG